MTFLSRKADYALLILYFLSRKEKGASCREISEAFQLGRPFLANILKSLSHGGLVISHRGIHGGYVLSRPTNKIRLTDVLNALTETFYFNECNTSNSDSEIGCAILALCPIRQGMASLHNRILAMLEDIKLNDLFAPAPGLHLIDLNLDAVSRHDSKLNLV